MRTPMCFSARTRYLIKSHEARAFLRAAGFLRSRLLLRDIAGKHLLSAVSIRGRYERAFAGGSLRGKYLQGRSGAGSTGVKRT